MSGLRASPQAHELTIALGARFQVSKRRDIEGGREGERDREREREREREKKKKR